MRSSMYVILVLSGLLGGCTSASQAGNRPTDVEFETVCSVSGPEETSRDTCKVVDYFRDGIKTQTDLNFPEFGIVLIWQPGNKVNVGSEGEDWGTTEFTTSEGETRFTIGRITYYYISDRDLAARETGG